VELLLTDRRIKKTIVRNNERKPLFLHKRIEEYRKKNPVMADHLMAIKFLGNDASHASGLLREDLLNAFEILSEVIDEVYGRRRQRLSKMTKRIIKKKDRRRAIISGQKNLITQRALHREKNPTGPCFH
jgi:hypothetical protein